jgi:hypothetical protein
MAKAPPVPPEQTNQFGSSTPGGGHAGSPAHDVDDNLQNGQPGNADVNLKQQGQTAATFQGSTHQGLQQDR